MSKSIPLVVLLIAYGCKPAVECDKTTSFLDADGDGFGDSRTHATTCGWTGDRVLIDGDCDDANSTIHPDATEICNGVDDDCSGLMDDDDPGLDISTASTWYDDIDGDGFGDDATEVQQCSPPAGTISDGGDCDDLDIEINPDIEEECSGIDEDCDGLIDDEDDSVDRRCRGVIYMVSENNPWLYTLDPVTLDVLPIGPMTNDRLDHGDIAWHATEEKLVMTHGEIPNVYSIDLNIGAATQDATSTGLNELYGIAYSSADDVLYAYDDQTFGIYDIDPVSGTPTELGQTADGSITAMTYDSARDQLITLSAWGLRTLDPVTGDGVELAENGLVGGSMTYDPTTDLLWAVDHTGVVVTVDPTADYAYALVLNNLPQMMAIEYVP